ncbi:MAG: AMP-binding protein, partial [Candidatus Binatia bacterium]
MRRKIHAAWGAPIVEFYAASEALYIAVKDRNAHDEMDVIEELNIIEVLDADHRAVSPREQGRVVLTSLLNYVLPVLRYELGDYVELGKARSDSPAMAATIRSVKGRVNDALPVVLKDGRQDSIHPLVLPIYVPGLEKIQFISRHPDRVQIEYVGQGDLEAPLRYEFQKILDMKGAAGTSFSVRRVSQIANDPETGKFRLIQVERAPQRFANVVAAASLADPRSNACLGPTNSFLAFHRQAIEQSIPARFEQMVISCPDRLAVKASDAARTYEQLNRMANRVGQSILKSRGNGSEPIGLQLEHGPALVSAILGVLKAGKFYVYLDPSYPASRIAAILEGAQPGLIITNDRGRHQLTGSWGSSIPYLNIDELDPAISSENP